jgi:hypothetical protein
MNGNRDWAMSRRLEAGIVDWQAFLAEMIAKQDFYRALGRQAELARRGEAGLPIVPPTEELAFVDGFLVWKGRPVWWSGEGGPALATSGVEGPGFVNTDAITRPVPLPAPSRSPGFLSWLGLRRRLA